MTNPLDPETGAPLQRDLRPFTLAYKGASITIDMAGWYGDGPDEGVFDAEDTKVSDRVLKRLKARGWSSKDRRGVAKRRDYLENRRKRLQPELERPNDPNAVPGAVRPLRLPAVGGGGPAGACSDDDPAG